MEALGLAYVTLGLVVGVMIGWLITKQRMGSEIIRYEERINAHEGAFETNERRMTVSYTHLTLPTIYSV